MNTENLKQFLALQQERAEIEARDKELAAQLACLEKQILTEFERTGINSVSIDGKVLFLYRKLVSRAKDGDKGRLIKAMRECGMAEYVKDDPTYNTQSVEAWVRAQLDEGQPLPEPLKEALEITELFFVRTKKAS